MTFTETFSVKALAPFDFDLTAQIFRSGDRQIRIYANRQFNQVLNINSKLAQVKVTSLGTVEQPEISVELKSTSPLTLLDKQKAEETIKFIFNLDFDLGSFYRDVEKDQIMHQIAQQLC